MIVVSPPCKLERRKAVPKGQAKIKPHIEDVVIWIKNYPLAEVFFFFFWYLSIYALFLLVEIKNNSNIMVKYHPKFWTEGIYQCCRQTEKLAPGCEKYSLFENSKYMFSYDVLWAYFSAF